VMSRQSSVVSPPPLTPGAQPSPLLERSGEGRPVSLTPLSQAHRRPSSSSEAPERGRAPHADKNKNGAYPREENTPFALSGRVPLLGEARRHRSVANRLDADRLFMPSGIRENRAAHHRVKAGPSAGNRPDVRIGPPRTGAATHAILGYPSIGSQACPRRTTSEGHELVPFAALPTPAGPPPPGSEGRGADAGRGGRRTRTAAVLRLQVRVGRAPDRRAGAATVCQPLRPAPRLLRGRRQRRQRGRQCRRRGLGPLPAPFRPWPAPRQPPQALAGARPAGRRTTGLRGRSPARPGRPDLPRAEGPGGPGSC